MKKTTAILLLIPLVIAVHQGCGGGTNMPPTAQPMQGEGRPSSELDPNSHVGFPPAGAGTDASMGPVVQHIHDGGMSDAMPMPMPMPKPGMQAKQGR